LPLRRNAALKTVATDEWPYREAAIGRRGHLAFPSKQILKVINERPLARGQMSFKPDAS
jgi:hypothetical protein